MTQTAVELIPELDPEALEIVVSERDSATTIALTGEWGLAEQPATRATIREALGRSPVSLILDLSQVSFIDSSGLHVVIELHERAQHESVGLTIVPGPRAVQRLFEICRLSEVLPFVAAAQRG